MLHFFIFYLEAFAWAGPLARKIFGAQDPQELAVTKFYAYNQGIYNLALGIIALTGALWLIWPGATNNNIGLALVVAGCGAMLLAALALGLASAQHRSAAVKQGTLPLLAVIFALCTWLFV